MEQSGCVIARILEARFGKMPAQALVFGRARLSRMDIQFIDVKHMSELCERYRVRLRVQIASYRLWQSAHEVETDSIARLYSATEGAILHRRLSDDLKLWFIAHKDYHAIRKAYLIKCMGPHMRVDWKKAA